MQISGFTIVRNATLLDFPLEASIRSLLPAVDELVVNVGVSNDDTLARVAAIGDPKIRVLEATWNDGRGIAMLAEETQRVMTACRHAWGIYIQADEVLADGSAQRLRQAIERCDRDQRIEGVVVDYRHFYGSFDTIARNRKWYRREIRAVRLGSALDIRSYRDAQGFRVGAEARRVRCAVSGAVMHHYGWARPEWALAAKRAADYAIDPITRRRAPGRPLLPWIPGLETFSGDHPVVAHEWIAARRTDVRLVAPFRPDADHLRFAVSAWVERLTGWRPFEYRNFTLVDSG